MSTKCKPCRQTQTNKNQTTCPSHQVQVVTRPPRAKRAHSLTCGPTSPHSISPTPSPPRCPPDLSRPIFLLFFSLLSAPLHISIGFFDGDACVFYVVFFVFVFLSPVFPDKANKQSTPLLWQEIPQIATTITRTQKQKHSINTPPASRRYPK
jgi:hypothetical protein